jgi:outer membrane receptor protein involved in Fe transport
MTHILRETPKPSSVRSRALTGVALSAVSLAITLPGFALAQEASETQEITVTGSRIKAPNLTSDSPVAAIPTEEIKQSNTQNIENLLNNLPSVTADYGGVQSSLIGSTISTVNLRDLDATRTLVLIDGHRVGPGDPSSRVGSATDINFIPVTLVQSVDVLTGGASAVYGSDAVAGVVNFHLIRDFQGAQVDFSYSAAQHNNTSNSVANAAFAASGYKVTAPPANTFDGFIRESSGIVGANSPDNKGNVTMYADYRSTTPVAGSQRSWEACPIYPSTTNNKPYKYCLGSSTSPYGKFPSLPGYGTVSNNPNGTATFTRFTGAEAFNFSGTSYLQRQDDRSSLGALGHYSVNEHAELYTEMMFMKDSSQQQDGAGGLFVGGVPGIQSTLTVPCNNPYLGHTVGPLGFSQATAIGCTAGVTSVNINFPGLRFTQPRQDVIDHDDYRALAGVRGDIDGNWSYDVSASHWVATYSLKDQNWALLPLVNSAMANGTLNIFQYGGDTQAQQNAVSGTALQTGQNGEDDVVASVTGDLGPYGGKSPFATNPIAVAAGLEYRHTTLQFTPDQNFQSGYVLGGNTTLPINGGEMVEEEFGEIRAPIIQNLPYVQALNLNLAMRHSDYSVDNSSSAFSTNTYKISADYAPTDDIRFRGGYNRAARAPNVYELFLGDSLGSDGGYQDPCAGNQSGTAPGNPAYKSICTNPALGKASVTAAQFNSGLIPFCSSSQCTAQTGGNTALKPEEADTWTYGFNATPSFLPGFNASVDYWDIKIANYIGTQSGSAIVNGCYSGILSYCQYIHRDPTNGSISTGDGYVSETNVNLDSIHNRGIDLDLNYTKKLEELGLGDMGAINLHLTGTYLIQAETQVQDSLKAFNCAGLFGTSCGDPQPNWRHQMRVTWETPYNANVSVNWRYIGGVKLDANDPNNPGYGNAAGYDGLDSSINAYSYIDLAASYKLWEKYTFRAGVNNLMDKDPPIVNQQYGIGGNAGGQNGNTFTMYDVMGRVIYMSFSAKL